MFGVWQNSMHVPDRISKAVRIGGLPQNISLFAVPFVRVRFLLPFVVGLEYARLMP